MFFRIFVALLLFMPTLCRAQDDVCEALTAILRDAPNEFRNVRTQLVETGVSLKAYRTGIHVPGTIKERFVKSFGLFYEGALAQSTNTTDLKTKFDLYKKMLDRCLAPMGLKGSNRPLFDPRLKDFQKIVYLPPYDKNSDVTSLKGHVAMEVDYNKANGTYTLELFIFEH